MYNSNDNNIMKGKIYESPEVRVENFYAEGVLCSSPMQLPDVDWKEDVDW